MGNALAAEMLDTGATALASYAAAELLDGATGATTGRIGGFRDWQAFFLDLIGDLSASVRLGAPAVFSRRVRWHEAAFRARAVQGADLGAAIAALERVLHEQLPAPARDACDACFKAASAGTDAPVTARLSADTENGRLALAYLSAIFEGDRRKAIKAIVHALDEGRDVHDLYERVLIPAMVETGRLWHLGEVSVAEEHFVSDTTRSAFAILAHRAPTAPANGRTVIAASVQGNAHDIGARVIADFFEFAGWRAICLGADAPSADLARVVVYLKADLVALSVAIVQHIESARRAIELLREASPNVKVLVGGNAFREAPELWEQTGADGSVGTAREAPALGLRLVGGATT